MNTQQKLIFNALRAIDHLFASDHDAVPSDLFVALRAQFGQAAIDEVRKAYFIEAEG